MGHLGLTQDHSAGSARTRSQALAEGAHFNGVAQRGAGAVHADKRDVLWAQLRDSQCRLDQRCLSRAVGCSEPARAACLVVCRACTMNPV